jgi:hypothetical protein
LRLTLGSVFDFIAPHALKLFLELELEDLAWISSLSNLLCLHNFLKDVLEIFSGILLLSGLELWMILSNQSFENGRADSILIEFLFSFLFLCHFVSDNFLSKLLLGVLSR